MRPARASREENPSYSIIEKLSLRSGTPKCKKKVRLLSNVFWGLNLQFDKFCKIPFLYFVPATLSQILQNAHKGKVFF